MLISIVVPVFNESENISELYRRIRTQMEHIPHDFELIFVNDGSHDSSDEVLDRIASEDEIVRVIHFRRNFGQTAAMMAGFDFAAGEIIVPMDADLQNDPADIPKLLVAIEKGADVCSGWRKDRQDNALQRNIPSILANRLISAVSGVRLHDFGCSLKAYRAEVVKGVRLYGEMHRFLPIYASWHGARISEVIVSHNPRSYGKSNYGMDRVLKVLCDLVVVMFLDKYEQKPMHIFGAAGALSLIISFVSGCFALFLRFFRGKSLIETPLPLLVVMSAITGVMCILMGLLAEMIMRTFYESQGKSVYLVKATRNVPETRNGK